MGYTPDWELDAFMKAEIRKGKKESIVTDLVIKLLGLDVSYLPTTCSVQPGTVIAAFQTGPAVLHVSSTCGSADNLTMTMTWLMTCALTHGGTATPAYLHAAQTDGLQTLSSSSLAESELAVCLILGKVL